MGKEVCIDPGTVIIRAGDPADKLFLLLEGAVQVELAHNLEAKATRLAVFAPGVFFGEAALLGQLRRTANVVARTKARCWQLEAAQFASLKATSSEVAWAVLVVIGRQLASHVSAANSLIDKLES
jgi:sulfate permease, SulP family